MARLGTEEEREGPPSGDSHEWACALEETDVFKVWER